MQKISGAGAFQHGLPSHYVDQLVTESLSVGTYSIPVGGVDDQQPHREDEIYVVTTGRATLVTPSRTELIGPGDVLFVPGEEPHRFVDVTEDLALLVLFAPAYTGRHPDLVHPDDAS
jgi:mannose-6-phosphate isomerase-like protein (cupin superfamily)